MNGRRKPVTLLTGSKPFGGHRLNSSWEAARIAGKRLGAIDGRQVIRAARAW